MFQPEYLVILIGLVLGYWLVSRYLSRTSGEKESPAQREHPNQNTVDASSASQPMPWDSVLGVLDSASVEEIRKAHKVLMSQYHPDKVASLGPDLRALAERKSKEINIAYRQAMRVRGVGEQLW